MKNCHLKSRFVSNIIKIKINVCKKKFGIYKKIHKGEFYKWVRVRIQNQLSEVQKKFRLIHSFHSRVADIKLAEPKAWFKPFSQSHKKGLTSIFLIHVFFFYVEKSIRKIQTSNEIVTFKKRDRVGGLQKRKICFAIYGTRSDRPMFLKGGKFFEKSKVLRYVP